MNLSGIHLNKTAVAVITGVIIVVVVAFRFYPHPVSLLGQKGEEMEPSKASAGVKSWYDGNLQEIPSEIIEKAKDFTPKGELKKIKFNGKDLKIFVRIVSAEKSKGDVLLLHGMKFSSETWEKSTKTYQFLAAAGYRAVGIDLPGFGQSDKEDVSDRAGFLAAVIKDLGLSKPVIVSPSMSGSFALPYLFSKPLETAVDRVAGYVPVAPVHTEKYSKEEYGQIMVPTAIITGQKDLESPIGKTSHQNLNQFPNKADFVIPEAGHAAYLNNTDMFHKIVLKLLTAIH